MISKGVWCQIRYKSEAIWNSWASLHYAIPLLYYIYIAFIALEMDNIMNKTMMVENYQVQNAFIWIVFVHVLS